MKRFGMAVLIVIAVVFLIGLVGEQSPQVGGQFQPETPSQTAEVPAAPAAPTLPADEANFISAIVNVRPDYAAAANELKKSNVYLGMVENMWSVLPSHRAEAWLGTIQNMGTDSDGDAYVTIEIADHIVVETTNNSLSDMMEHSLIKNGTPLYTALSNMSTGQNVKFTALLGDFHDLTEDGKVNDTEIAAQFSDIEAADGAAEDKASAVQVPESSVSAPVGGQSSEPAAPAPGAATDANVGPSTPPQGTTEPSGAGAVAVPPLTGTPEIVDTGDLTVDGFPVHLFGVVGLPQPFVGYMSSHIARAGGTVSCTPTQGAFICKTASGEDIGETAIANGVAKASEDAPQMYLHLEQNAQAARKGIWAYPDTEAQPEDVQ